MPDLSILCVSRGEECILPLLRKLAVHARDLNAECVMVADGDAAKDSIGFYLEGAGSKLFQLESSGYIESILDDAISLTTGRYVLRLDDDESLPDQTIQWLLSGEYLTHPHWKFARKHLWTDEYHYIANPPLYPDHQTRLSVREMSTGRTSIHCGSPFGGGELASIGVDIHHHKFLVKTLDERLEIVKRYNQIHPGAGDNFRVFSVPEMVLINPVVRAV